MEELREGVARIIDPAAFPGLLGDNDPGDRRRMVIAFTKADAIHNLYADLISSLQSDLGRAREALEPLVTAAEGLAHGSDWNRGTHALTHGYRQKLIDAIPLARSVLLSLPVEKQEHSSANVSPERTGTPSPPSPSPASAGPDEIDIIGDALAEALWCLESAARRPLEDPDHQAEVEALGNRIGYGALMTAASAGWRKSTIISGGEFVCAPCRGTATNALMKVRAAIEARQATHIAEVPAPEASGLPQEEPIPLSLRASPEGPKDTVPVGPWQTMETAPKDGTWILVFEPSEWQPQFHIVKWGDPEWRLQPNSEPKTWVTMALGPNPDTYTPEDVTNWMPLFKPSEGD